MIRYEVTDARCRYFFARLVIDNPWIRQGTMFSPRGPYPQRESLMDDVRTWVIEQTGDDHTVTLRILQPQAVYTPSYKLGVWDGTTQAEVARQWLRIGSEFMVRDPDVAFAFRMRWS